MNSINIKNYKHNNPNPVPQMLLDYIAFIEQNLGSPEIVKHTDITIRTNNSRKAFRYGGRVNVFLMDMIIYSYGETLTKIFQALAHEYAHLYIYHVLKVDSVSDSKYKKTFFDNDREEFLADALADKTLADFIRQQTSNFYQNKAEVEKYLKGVK